MRTCLELVELLMDFVSDQIPPEKRGIIGQHLACCSPCSAYIESYRILVGISRRLPIAPLPFQREQRLQAVLQESDNE